MAATSPTFVQGERVRAVAWKMSSPTVPGAARVPAPYVQQDGSLSERLYPFCLPPEHATVSLLPEVRETALGLFAELRIPWHAGVDGGPSNHLLSSQVQCVNALGQMIHDPDRLVRAFGPVVGTDEVLEIEPGRWLTFEYIGDTDYFHEALNGQRTRGAHCTSVDAAFVHRTVERVVELVLVEWKYTESYRQRTIDPVKDEVRRQRYGTALTDPDGPVRADLLGFSDLVDEPLYQLMRQQLLAHQLEHDRAHGAARVRVVHVHPTANLAYQQSLQRPTQRALGDTVGEVWAKLLRHPDRYVEMDSAVFLDPEITSVEYVARYGAPAGIVGGVGMNELPAESLRRRLDADPDADMRSLERDTDQVLSIGHDVWRLRWRGQVTTAVGADADLHTTCGALLDALAVLETTDDPSVDRSTINVLIDRPMPGEVPSETAQAMRSMRDATVDVTARVWYRRDGVGWVEDGAPAPTWPRDDPRITGWVNDLLIPRLTTDPHPFAVELVQQVDDPSLHLYPSEIALTSGEVWALRVDGLEIGIVRPTTATLTIGKPGATGDGPQRTAFTEVFGRPEITVVAGTPVSPDEMSIAEAVMRVRALLRRFRDVDVRGAPITHRTKAGVGLVDEHALEARLLKGLVRLEDPGNGLVLDDRKVARGSQFPTLWGHGGRARYLDALLTDGTTPLAVELKVATGGQGRYYRRSIIQAVLYRHFILNTPDLDPWFDHARLDRTAARAAIGIPVPDRWTERFATTHRLLVLVAAHVGTSVHLLDARTTPERRSTETVEPDPDVVETLSWQLAAALSKRWPTALGRVVELHDGGGQYDQLQLQSVNDRAVHVPSPGPRISLNRAGSVFLFSPTGSWRWVWRNIWPHLAAGGDIDDAATVLGSIAGLGPPEHTEHPTFAELAAEFLEHVGPGWSWRCAAGGGDVESWLEPYRPVLRRYGREGHGWRLSTIARIWGAIRNGQAAVIIDQNDLRVWVNEAAGCREIDACDIRQGIHLAVEAPRSLD